jgi:maltooligosyltrehalose trehalohydrolase
VTGPGELLDSYPWERPLGARMIDDFHAEFRVWAPRAQSVKLLLDGQPMPLNDAGFGVREAVYPATPGDDYEFVLDGQELPDPCSRWQPDGLRGPSRLLDVRALPAREDGFSVPRLRELVIYELHVGTFTDAGTFAAAAERLAEVADLGVTAIELMPVAEFPGRRGWGYDGVYLSAAQSSYGGPAQLAALVATAHRHGLAVILDVVYNHLGASGTEAMSKFGPYFGRGHGTPWGPEINFDGEDCDPVREWVCQSAEGWIRDFGVDGLRLDAVHAITDASAEHIAAAVARRVHALKPGALVIAESGRNDPIVVRGTERGGWGCDAVWADDFHHALRTLLSEDRDGYYADYGQVAQLAKAFARPFVFDGGYSGFRRRRYGAPAADVPAHAFVVYAQNHDQVGNRPHGDRMPAVARPLAAFCTLLSPFVPLLFMGEEYGELAPFQFFCDHIDEEIAAATREGRRTEFAAFLGFAADVPDPGAESTFERSVLTRQREPGLTRLYKDLIAARRTLAPGDADAVSYDELARWLLVRRGRHTLACNFGTGPLELAIGAAVGEAERGLGGEVVLSAGGEARLEAGSLKLGPMCAALIR